MIAIAGADCVVVVALVLQAPTPCVAMPLGLVMEMVVLLPKALTLSIAVVHSK